MYSGFLEVVELYVSLSEHYAEYQSNCSCQLSIAKV
jgi:hypothetical protein